MGRIGRQGAQLAAQEQAETEQAEPAEAGRRVEPPGRQTLTDGGQVEPLEPAGFRHVARLRGRCSVGSLRGLGRLLDGQEIARGARQSAIEGEVGDGHEHQRKEGQRHRAGHGRPQAAEQEPRAEAQGRPSVPGRDRLRAHVLEQGRQQVRLVAMVPGIEPDRPRAIAAQIGPQQVHQRALAGAPAAGDGDGDRRLRGLVAQDARQGERDRLELQRIAIRPVDRPVGAGRPGDALALDEAASHEAGAKEADQQQQGRPGHEHPGCRVATKLTPAAIDRLVRFGLGIGVVQHEQFGPRRRDECGPGLAQAPGHQQALGDRGGGPERH